MTIIEFFDRGSAIENMVSTLLCAPDKVVFIGDSSKKMWNCIEKYRAVTESRGLNVEFDAKGVGKNNLMAIVGAIEDVIKENEDCVIDLSGGDDLYLVAVGIVYGEYADSVKLHRFNIANSTMTDCDSDGILCACGPMEISVEENIALYGGRVIYNDEKGNGTRDWHFDEEFVDDVYVMWSVCKENPTRWNVQISTLDKLCGVYLDPEELTVYINIEEAKKILGEKGEAFSLQPDTFRKLNALGVINNLKIDSISYSFTFKNEQVMKCLTKAGQILELIIAIMAMETDDENGEPLYNDVMTGVYIDWDGTLQPEFTADVENEIDVILMKGMIPVFVSCKNGIVSMDELYKLSVVAERFGGKFVRKVLVASELEKSGPKEAYIRARAESMGIKIVSEVDTIAEDALRKKIKNLWCSE